MRRADAEGQREEFRRHHSAAERLARACRTPHTSAAVCGDWSGVSGSGGGEVVVEVEVEVGVEVEAHGRG